jgi:hypothetical protein
MADEQTPPIAQGEQLTDGQEAQQPAGVEVRINQLVAEREEARRQMEALQSQAQQREAQYLAMLERMSTQQAQAAQPAAPEIDPALAAAMAHYMKPLQDQFAQVQHQLYQQNAQMQFQQRASQEDPRVVQKAQELLSQWKQTGKTGWNPEDALVFARGILGVATPQQANRDALGRFNAGAQSLPGQSAPAPATNPQRVVELDRSSTDNRYLEAQAAALEKSLGDMEF